MQMKEPTLLPQTAPIFRPWFWTVSPISPMIRSMLSGLKKRSRPWSLPPESRAFWRHHRLGHCLPYRSSSPMRSSSAKETIPKLQPWNGHPFLSIGREKSSLLMLRIKSISRFYQQQWPLFCLLSSLSLGPGQRSMSVPVPPVRFLPVILNK